MTPRPGAVHRRAVPGASEAGEDGEEACGDHQHRAALRVRHAARLGAGRQRRLPRARVRREGGAARRRAPLPAVSGAAAELVPDCQ